MPRSIRQLPESPHPQRRHHPGYDRDSARPKTCNHPIPRRRRPEKFKKFSDTNPFGRNLATHNILHLFMDNINPLYNSGAALYKCFQVNAIHV